MTFETKTLMIWIGSSYTRISIVLGILLFLFLILTYSAYRIDWHNIIFKIGLILSIGLVIFLLLYAAQNI